MALTVSEPPPGGGNGGSAGEARHSMLEFPMAVPDVMTWVISDVEEAAVGGVFPANSPAVLLRPDPRFVASFQLAGNGPQRKGLPWRKQWPRLLRYAHWGGMGPLSWLWSRKREARA